MPKAKDRKKTNKPRHNPTGLPSASEVQKMIDAGILPAETERNLPPILHKIDSADAVDREEACNGISHLVLETDGESDELFGALEAMIDQDEASGGAESSTASSLTTNGTRKLSAAVQDAITAAKDKGGLVNLQVLLDYGVVAKLCARICDPEGSVRIAAAGALRNLAFAGGVEVAEKLMSSDIVTPLVATLQQALRVASTLGVQQPQQPQQKPVTDSDSASMDATTADNNGEGAEVSKKANKVTVEQEIAFDILEQLIHFTALLCTNSEKATKALTQLNTCAFLIEVLQLKGCPIEILLACAHCMNVMSDDNIVFAQQMQAIGNGSGFGLLYQMATDPSLSILLRVTLAAVLVNLTTSINNSESNDTNSAVVELLKTVNRVYPILASALQNDAVAEFTRLLPELTKEDAMESEEYQGWESLMKAQKLALEILTNIFTTSGEAIEEEQQNEEVMEDGDDGDDINDLGETTAAGSELAEEVTCFILNNKLLTAIPEKYAQLNKSVSTVVTPVSNKAQLLMDTTSLICLSCLRNMTLLLSAQALQTVDMKALFKYLFDCCVESTTQLQQLQTADAAEAVTALKEDKIDSLTSIMWSIMRKIKIVIGDGITPDVFVHLSRTSNNEDIRVNCVGILGEMGKHVTDPAQNKLLGELLLFKLSDQSMSVVAESLNAIFDVYADERFDSNVKDLKMVEKLNIYANVLKAKVTQHRRELKRDPEVFSRIQEARLNLTAFIKYKQQKIR